MKKNPFKYFMVLLLCFFMSACSNGLNAMYYALEYYKGQNIGIMKSIINYNEIDCKVMYEILKYLRKSYDNLNLII